MPPKAAGKCGDQASTIWKLCFDWRSLCKTCSLYIWHCAINPCIFPFQWEWLSCVHSVYPFQHLTGTTAETFVQVQFFSTELRERKKKSLGKKRLARSSIPRQERAERHTNLPLSGSKPGLGLLNRCVITHYDCGVLTCRYAWYSSHGSTSVITSISIYAVADHKVPRPFLKWLRHVVFYGCHFPKRLAGRPHCCISWQFDHEGLNRRCSKWTF